MHIAPPLSLHLHLEQFLSKYTRDPLPRPMAVSLSSFSGSSSAFTAGDPGSRLMVSRPVPARAVAARRQRFTTLCMGNVNEGRGVFAPLVVATRDIIGKKQFNQLRGKAIALHSQVIAEFCKSIGADGKQRQGLIRLAKKNGELLGFLA